MEHIHQQEQEQKQQHYCRHWQHDASLSSPACSPFLQTTDNAGFDMQELLRFHNIPDIIDNAPAWVQPPSENEEEKWTPQDHNTQEIGPIFMGVETPIMSVTTTPEEIEVRNRFVDSILNGGSRDDAIKIATKRSRTNTTRRKTYRYKKAIEHQSQVITLKTDKCKRLFMYTNTNTGRELYEQGDINDSYLLNCCVPFDDELDTTTTAAAAVMTAAATAADAEATATTTTFKIENVDCGGSEDGGQSTIAINKRKRVHGLTKDGIQCTGRSGHGFDNKGHSYHYSCNPIYGKAVLWVLMNTVTPVSIRTCIKNGQRIFALSCEKLPSYLRYEKMRFVILHTERQQLRPFVRNIGTMDLSFPEIVPCYLTAATAEENKRQGGHEEDNPEERKYGLVSYQMRNIMMKYASTALHDMLSLLWPPTLVHAFPNITHVTPHIHIVLDNCKGDNLQFVEFLTTTALKPVDKDPTLVAVSDYEIYASMSGNPSGVVFILPVDKGCWRKRNSSIRYLSKKNIRVLTDNHQIKCPTYCKAYVYNSIQNSLRAEDVHGKANMLANEIENCDGVNKIPIQIVWVKSEYVSGKKIMGQGEIKQILFLV